MSQSVRLNSRAKTFTQSQIHIKLWLHFSSLILPILA
jgi:hypothetical protein